MRALIERICAQEGVVVDDAVYPLVIRAGGGSPRDTLSVLDQLVAGSDDGPDGPHVTYQRALGAAGRHRRRADRRRRRRAGRRGCRGVVRRGRVGDRRRPRPAALRHRPAGAVPRSHRAASRSGRGIRGVVDAPEDVLERMRDQAARIGTATLTRYAEVVQAGLGEMRGATAPRLLLEVVCARLLLPSASDTESALLQRVERIETRLDMSIPGVRGRACGRRRRQPPTQYARNPAAGTGRATQPEPPARVRRPEAATPEPVTEPPPEPADRRRAAAGARNPSRPRPNLPPAAAGRTQRGRGAHHVADGAGEGAPAQPHHRGDAGRRHRPRGRGRHAGADPRVGAAGQAAVRAAQRRRHRRGAQGRAGRELAGAV